MEVLSNHVFSCYVLFKLAFENHFGCSQSIFMTFGVYDFIAYLMSSLIVIKKTNMNGFGSNN